MQTLDILYMSKRGNADESSATTSAAALILLIALFFVVYLLLLPQGAREDVLKSKEIDFDEFDDLDNGNGDNGDNNEKETLLLRNPGRVLPPEEDTVTKEFASVNIFATTDKKTETVAKSIIVSKNIFQNNFRDVAFTVDNTDELERLNLFFNIKEANGNLVIYLNGDIIFEGEAGVSDLPIEIPVQNLLRRNILRFSVKDGGFFGFGKYELKDVGLVQEFRLENTKEARQFEVAPKLLIMPN